MYFIGGNYDVPLLAGIASIAAAGNSIYRYLVPLEKKRSGSPRRQGSARRSQPFQQNHTISTPT